LTRLFQKCAILPFPVLPYEFVWRLVFGHTRLLMLMALTLPSTLRFRLPLPIQRACLSPPAVPQGVSTSRPAWYAIARGRISISLSLPLRHKLLRRSLLVYLTFLPFLSSFPVNTSFRAVLAAAALALFAGSDVVVP